MEMFHYRHARISAKTNFFLAASQVLTSLASKDFSGGGRFVSDNTSKWLDMVSADLETKNMARYRKIVGGEITTSRSVAQNDNAFVEFEQAHVQTHLDNLQASDPIGFAKMIGEINGLFNNKASRRVLRFTDSKVFRALEQVEETIDGEFDFSNKEHRVALGQTLLKNIRGSNTCIKTGTRLKSC